MKTKLLLTALVGAAAFSVTTANAQVCDSEYSYETVYFNHDSSTRGSYESQIQGVANAINACGGSDVQIVCHTDTSGSAIYNQALSERRAEQMFKDLLALGVSSASITSRTGEGETNNALPLGDGVKEEANRRCNITIRNSAYAPVVDNTFVETYAEPTYVESTPTVESYSEVINRPGTPIESTTVETVVPSTPEPITSYQSVTTTNPPVASAPVYNTPPPPTPPASLPPVSTGGFGASPLLIGGAGIAAGVIGYLIGDGESSDAPFEEAVAAANTATAQAQEEAADRAAAESALAASQTRVAELEAENELLQGQLDGTISP